MTCLHICLRVYIINYFLLKVCLNNHAFVKSIPIVYRKSYMCVYKHVKCALQHVQTLKTQIRLHICSNTSNSFLWDDSEQRALPRAEAPADPSLPDSGPGFHCSHVTKVMLTHGMAQ